METTATENAIDFGVSTEFDVLAVGLQMESGNYALFQNSIENDKNQGGEPYFEYGDQINGGYGLVSRCVVNDSKLLIELKRPLNGVNQLVISLTKVQEQTSEIINQLKSIFSECSGVLVVEIA